MELAELTISSEVLFEVDDGAGAEAWSVVLRGCARTIDLEAEIAEVEALELKPMVPTVKRNCARVEPVSISGRCFVPGEGAPRDGMQMY